MFDIIKPYILTKPLREKDGTYKLYPVILVGCFIQKKVISNTRQILSKSEPEGRILHIYPNSMQLKKVDRYYDLKLESSHIIPKEIKKLLEGVRKITDGKWEYIQRLVY